MWNTEFSLELKSLSTGCVLLQESTVQVLVARITLSLTCDPVAIPRVAPETHGGSF
jgi:hypothetical protein